MLGVAIAVRVRPRTNLLAGILQDIPALPIADRQDWRRPARSGALGLVILATVLLVRLKVAYRLRFRDSVWT